MSADCTIVIISHKRPKYLERCVRWFTAMPYPVVIADSGDAEWSSELRSHPAVRYIFRRGGLDVFILKLQAAFAAAETPFVAMCDDDDFSLPDGIAHSVEFLKTRPDYSFCVGYSYMFQPFRQHLVAWPLRYRHNVASPSWIERIEQASSAFYGVNRTENLRAAYEFLARQDFSENILTGFSFVDFVMTATVARRGKFKRLPLPYHLREYGGAAVPDGERPATITSHMVPDLFRNLLPFLMQGDESDAARDRLQRVCSRYYAGLLHYDLTQRASKRRFARFLPDDLVWRAEYAYRLLRAGVEFASPSQLQLLKLYRHPDYPRFREFARLPGDRKRP